MKKTVSLLAIVSALFTLSFALTIKVGIYDNPPLSFYESGKAQGIFPEVLNYIAQKEKWHLSYIYAPQFELLNELKSGKIDMLLAIAQTGARSKLYNFSKEYFISNWAQVYQIAGGHILSIFDLEGKRIGVLRSDVYYKGKLGIAYLLEKFGVHAKFVVFNTYSDIFKALSEKKIDAGVANRIFGDTHKFKYNLKETPIVFSPIEVRAAFSKMSVVAKIVEPIVDDYLKKMKVNKNSILNTSIDKYLLHPPRKTVFPKWIFYVAIGSIIVFLILLVNIFILRKMIKKATDELKRKNAKLTESYEELSASDEEIRAMNEELENAYNNLEKLTSRFQAVMILLSQMDMIKIGEEEFLNQLLDRALEMIPIAKYGSVWTLDKGRTRFVAVRGHDEKILKDITNLKALPLDNKPQIVKNILEEDKKTVLPDVFQKLKKATKPIKETLIAPLSFANKLFGHISIDIPKESKESFSKDDVEILSNFAKIATSFYVSRKYLRTQRELQDRLTLVLVKALEKYDGYTEGHSERVANCSREMAKRMGLNEKVQRKIYQAGLIHDIGKIFIPIDVLTKKGKLTDKEYEKIKEHPEIGAELIEEGAGLEDIATTVRCHHERWDGNGYPDGLKDEEIPIGSRIIAVCDAYDAMTSNRPYRKALSRETALKEIEKNEGKQFDPVVSKVFLEWMRIQM